MAKLGTLLEKLFKKAGVDTSSDDLKALFDLDTDIPDDVSGKVDKSLLTVDAAKSHSDVIKAIKATTLAGADSKMDELIISLGLQPGEDFVANKNTFEKIGMLTKLALEAGKKAAAPGDKQAADKWAEKEAEYNRQLKELKESITAKESEFAKTRENDLTSFAVKTILSGKDYIFPKEMDSDLKVNTAFGAINNELNKKGFTLKRNEAGQLVILNKDGQPAYSDTNEALEPNTFIDGVLAQNKLLKVNDPNQQQDHQPNGSNGTQFIQQPGLKGNSAIVADIDAQIAQLNK
ncbi:hypothetical protein JMG10_07570 [Nostoc ellipsosporum NOK]|nr:hypothetical protein [Nostoc ellipsosporum NOK]